MYTLRQIFQKNNTAFRSRSDGFIRSSYTSRIIRNMNSPTVALRIALT